MARLQFLKPAYSERFPPIIFPKVVCLVLFILSVKREFVWTRSYYGQIHAQLCHVRLLMTYSGNNIGALKKALIVRPGNRTHTSHNLGKSINSTRSPPTRNAYPDCMCETLCRS